MTDYKRRYDRKTVYKRDLLGANGRQFVLPWGPGKTISPQQAAQRLGMSDTTVREMCEEGVLQAWRIRPDKKKSPWRIATESVDLYNERKMALYDTSKK